MKNLSYIIQRAEERVDQFEKQKAEAQVRQKQKDDEEKKLASERKNELKLKKELETFQSLINHRDIIDLHGCGVNEAKSIAGSYANVVARSKSMKCVGFVHGKGLHSGPTNISDIETVLDSAFDPKIKPAVRNQLDNLARKYKCKSIYGESMFVIGVFDAAYYADELCSGITYFMNEQYYEFFDKFNYDWSLEAISQFQQVTR